MHLRASGNKLPAQRAWEIKMLEAVFMALPIITLIAGLVLGVTLKNTLGTIAVFLAKMILAPKNLLTRKKK